MRSIPTLSQFSIMFPDNQSCYQYLLENNIFYNSINCENCGFPMKRYVEAQVFRCNRSNCAAKSNRISIKKGTFFYESSLSYLEIIRLAQLWLAKISVETALILTSHSSHTVCNFFRHFRQLISSHLDEEDEIIGGPEIIVEIDETKLGKRKYNRGHRVDGVWVLVGIEKKINGKIFLVPIRNRSAETLTEIILRHVRPGSIINTDKWRGYNNLELLGFTHLTVNHSQTFVDPVTNACTNTVEGLNSGLKRRIPIRNRTENNIETHLAEYVWRRKNKHQLFEAFINAIRDIDYEFE